MLVKFIRSYSRTVLLFMLVGGLLVLAPFIMGSMKVMYYEMFVGIVAAIFTQILRLFLLEKDLKSKLINNNHSAWTSLLKSFFGNSLLRLIGFLVLTSSIYLLTWLGDTGSSEDGLYILLYILLGFFGTEIIAGVVLTFISRKNHSKYSRINNIIENARLRDANQKNIDLSDALLIVMILCGIMAFNIEETYYNISLVLLPIVIIVANVITTPLGFSLAFRYQKVKYQYVGGFARILSVLLTIAIISAFLHFLVPDTWQHYSSGNGIEKVSLLDIITIIITGTITGFIIRLVERVLNHTIAARSKKRFFALLINFIHIIVPVFLMAIGLFLAFELYGLHGVVLWACTLLASTAREIAFEAYSTNRIASIRFRYLRRQLRKQLIFRHN